MTQFQFKKSQVRYKKNQLRYETLQILNDMNQEVLPWTNEFSPACDY